MFKKFYNKKLKADYYTEDLLSFDWNQIQEKGIKLVFLDIDNTLATHGSRQPDDYAKAVINKVQGEGFDLCILSNARSSRSEEYASYLDVDFLENARKPSPKVLLKKLKEKALQPHQAVLAGDQLFTDVWAAKNAGCYSILVEQRFYDEDLHIKFKRKLEDFFIKKYGSRE